MDGPVGKSEQPPEPETGSARLSRHGLDPQTPEERPEGRVPEPIRAGKIDDLPRFNPRENHHLAAAAQEIWADCEREVRTQVNRVVGLLGKPNKLEEARLGWKSEKLEADIRTTAIEATREAAAASDASMLRQIVDGAKKSALRDNDKNTINAVAAAAGDVTGRSNLEKTLRNERSGVESSHKYAGYAKPEASPHLQTAIAEYEKAGQSALDLIDKYAFGPEQRWALRLRHLEHQAADYERHGEAQLAAEHRRLAGIEATGLLNAAMDARFVDNHTVEALASAPSDIDHRELTANFLARHGEILSHELTRGGYLQFKRFLDTAVAAVRGPGVEPAMITALDSAIGSHPAGGLAMLWRAVVSQVEGADADQIMNSMYGSLNEYEQDRFEKGKRVSNAYHPQTTESLSLCADDLAAKGRFDEAGKLLNRLAVENGGWDEKAQQKALRTCLSHAGSDAQINALKPGVLSEDQGESSLHARAALAIAANDPRALRYMAVTLADTLASQKKPSETIEAAAQVTYNAIAKASNGPVSLSLAKDMVNTMRAHPRFAIHNNQLARSLSEILIRNGDAEEAELTYRNITRSQLPPAERFTKLWHLSRLLAGKA
jgi:hypothetical protein